MANKIQLKRSAVPGKIPLVSDLHAGELAMNTVDAKVYFGTGTAVKRFLTEDDLTNIFGTTSSFVSVAPTPTDQFGTYVLCSFSIAVFRTLKIVVQVSQGTSFEGIELFVIHDGTNAQITEYARITTAPTGVVFGVEISGGELHVTYTQPATLTTVTAVVIALLV